MNTKLLMILSAVLMGITGIVLSFLPVELLKIMQLPDNGWPKLILQVLGAQYLGFAMLNWMARNNLIGGIYSRPVAIGNFMHFMVSSLALIKGAVAGELMVYWVITLLYLIFALCFGYIFATHPLKKNHTANS